MEIGILHLCPLTYMKAAFLPYFKVYPALIFLTFLIAPM